MNKDEKNIYAEIENIANEQYKKQLNKLMDEIKAALFNLNDKSQYENILNSLSSLIIIILSISSNKIEKTKELYESYLRREEQTIRILYKNLLTQKIIKDSLENKIRLLTNKEKEYDLIKEKTGVYFKDGKLIYNKQKDNEIIILREENTNLKSIIENYEKLIKEKDKLYENLNNKFKSMKKNLSSLKKNKKIQIPNININLNDSHNLINTENISHYHVNIDNGKKFMKNKLNKNDLSNFNYIKYKNISKINSIPFNNCLTSRSYLQNSLEDINQKDNLSKKKTNSKIKEKINLLKNSDSQNDLCSLKKRPLKISEIFNFKKKQLNLLKAYTSGSSNNINNNKFYISKKLYNYFKEELTPSYHHKNNKSNQKTNSNNKINNSNNKRITQNSLEKENLHKSYIPNIPFNNDRKNKDLRKEFFNYKFVYFKTKRDNESNKNHSELYVDKNLNKKYDNINTKKIFSQTNNKKSEFI